MRYLITVVTILIWVGVVMIGIKSLAATTGSVTATVTAQIYSVTVVDAAVAYGSLALSASTDTNALSDEQQAGNNGNQTEKLNIQGSTSTPGSWTLGTTAGSETYVHWFATNQTNWVNLTTSYQTLIASIAQSATQTFDLKAQVPSSTSQSAQQNVNVTVQATSP